MISHMCSEYFIEMTFHGRIKGKIHFVSLYC